MDGRWLVVAVVVIGCCSLLAGWIGGGWLLQWLLSVVAVVVVG